MRQICNKHSVSPLFLPFHSTSAEYNAGLVVYSGEWRELAGQDQVAKTPEMVAVDADGKHIIPEPILK